MELFYAGIYVALYAVGCGIGAFMFWEDDKTDANNAATMSLGLIWPLILLILTACWLFAPRSDVKGLFS